MKTLFLVLLPLITSCGWGPFKRKHEQADSTTQGLDLLASKKRLYCELSKDAYDKKGYVVAKCDGLLFTSLRGIGCQDADVRAFESTDRPGRWYRSPTHDCFIPSQVNVDNGANSTISKDMILGLMNNLWYTKNLAAVDRTIEYGKSHSWIMGEAKDEATVASKCALSPGLISNLYDMQSKLNGSGLNITAPSSEDDAVGVNTGFRAHLDVLHVIFSGSLYGAINDIQISTLKNQAKRMPRNAMYQAAKSAYDGGDQSAAVSLLMDEKRFPADRLPTSAEFCSDYLWTDDDTPKDWEPCPDGKTIYEGLDFIIAASIADGSFFKRP